MHRGRLVLVHAKGGFTTQAFELDEAPREIRRLGTASDIVVPHQSVSRQPHTRVQLESALGVLYVEDLGRGPGTFLNGIRLGPERVTARSGALLQVGDVLFVFSSWLPSPLLDGVKLPPIKSYALTLAERMVHGAAQTDVHVLLLGPTGAGKERLAQMYHASTGRKGPFVPVNCAGIPSELFAAELFGHEKGAFSGAQKARPGLWRSAHEGTLFLDEVAELPVDQQSAVLRALDSGRVRPVGSDRDVEVDVRVIAATSRNVEELEEEGRLRADLVGRLAGLRITIPGLRERKEEVLSLMKHALGSGAAPLSLEAAERLLLHDWPKNIRELLNAAKVMKVFTQEMPEMPVELLPESIRRRTAKAAPEAARSPARPNRGVIPDAEQIRALLEQHHGNVEGVARAFGVGRATVHRWLKRLSIDAESYRP